MKVSQQNTDTIKNIFVNYYDSLMEGYTYSLRKLSGFAFEQYTESLFNPLGVLKMPAKVAERNRKYVTTLASVPKPEWSTANTIVYETPIAILRDFSINPEDKSVRPVLVAPPQAGQHSCIADYSPEQSQVATIRDAGFNRIYAIEWRSASEETKTSVVEDYIAFMHKCVEVIGEPVNLIGDCQGGWQSTVFACLHPEDVNTLTVAGGPIDFQIGNGDIKNYINLINDTVGLEAYRLMVQAQNGVMDGNNMRRGFLALKPENAVKRFVDLYTTLDNEQAVERFKTFESWFMYAQNLPGTFYLWIVENLFLNNRLIKGELEVGGRKVDMKNLHCPIYLLAGAKDHITPPIQVFEMENYVSTPADKIMKLTNSGGHTGLFMGREALRKEWQVITADMLQYSQVQ